MTDVDVDLDDPAEVAEAWFTALAAGDIGTVWDLTSVDGRLHFAVMFAGDTDRAATLTGKLDVFNLADKGPGHRWWGPFTAWLATRLTNLDEALTGVVFETIDPPAADWPDGWALVAWWSPWAPDTPAQHSSMQQTAGGWRLGCWGDEPYAEQAAEMRRRRVEILASRPNRQQRRRRR